MSKTKELPFDKLLNARVDADLLVKIEIRRTKDSDERMSNPEKDLIITNYISQEISDLDSYTIHAITGVLVKATNEVVNNRW